MAEKKRVCFWPGRSLEDFFDVGEEAHVEHAVSFVEDEGLDVVEFGVGAAEVVDEPARGWR